jgi:hypothetical protein
MGRLALEQVNRVLDDQSRTMEEQSRKNERAARFAVGLVVAGIAVVSLLLTIGYSGGTHFLVGVVTLFGLFFLQAVTTAVAAIRLSTLSGEDTEIGLGPAPTGIVEGLREGRYRSEKVLLKSLLILASQCYPKNAQHIARTTKKRDRLVRWNLLSTLWLGSATLIYLLSAWV